jgi:hypothetical protein
MTPARFRHASAVAVSGIILLAGRATGQANPVAQDSQPATAAEPFCCDTKHFWTAGAELVALQAVPWYFNRHVSDDSTAALSFTSWRRNIQRGFEWDNNAVPTNMFMHPYHGNLFFNAARNNGYGYWESVPFAFAGSLMWEMFGENNKGAINDWVATSVGGIAIGEALYRTSQTVWDNRATGLERAGREFAGFLLNPIGGFNRAVRGEWSRVGPNPLDRIPTQSGAYLRAGMRSVEEGESGTMTRHPYFEVDLQYGDPFEGGFRQPFDAFRLTAQVNFTDKTPIGRLQVEGALWGTDLKRSEKTRHVFSLLQNFDYINNEAYETGGQRFSGAFLSDYRLSDGVYLGTTVQGSLLLLWGVSSNYAETVGRDYDFGSGAGLRFETQLNALRTDLVELTYELFWSRTVSGVRGDNFIHLLAARVGMPIWRSLGAGADFRLLSRSSAYRDFPDVKRTVPEFRLYVKLFPRRSPYWAPEF